MSMINLRKITSSHFGRIKGKESDEGSRGDYKVSEW